MLSIWISFVFFNWKSDSKCERSLLLFAEYWTCLGTWRTMWNFENWKLMDPYEKLCLKTLEMDILPLGILWVRIWHSYATVDRNTFCVEKKWINFLEQLQNGLWYIFHKRQIKINGSFGFWQTLVFMEGYRL